MPRIIALTGYAHTGKDTVGAGLIKYGFKRFAFADAVKVATGELYGLPTDIEWWDRMKSESIVTPPIPHARTYRDLLIHVGMTMRAVDPDIWVRAVLIQVKPEDDVVITDLRSPNEALALFKAGAFIVRLHRQGCEPIGEADHAVDAIDKRFIDVEFYNDGPLEEIETHIRAWKNAAPKWRHPL